MQDFSFKREIYRKAFHITSLWMPSLIMLTEKETALFVFGAILAVLLAYEWLRCSETSFGAQLASLFSTITRHHEAKHLTGATYMLAGALLVTAMAPAIVAATALTILMVSDSLAALIGRRFGCLPLAGKTLEGSATFFASALIIVMAAGCLYDMPSTFYLSGFLACAITTLSELYAPKLRLDDNLCIPLTFAITQLIFMHLFGGVGWQHFY